MPAAQGPQRSPGSRPARRAVAAGDAEQPGGRRGGPVRRAAPVRGGGGGASHRPAIGPLAGRASRFTLPVHLPGRRHTAEVVRDALVAALMPLPAQLRRSLTWDQGWEMRAHARIAVAADCEIYFCDPHSPWQRGSNENTNGLLRQYFPKGTSLARYSPGQLAAVADELNGRPRKTLGWKTPAEALAEILDRDAAA